MAFYVHAKSLMTSIAGSFWFVPLLMALAGLALGNLFVFIDALDALSGLREQSFYPRFGPEGARAVLTTIAGGMMTMASLVFSLTFVGLTQLSSQLGPRVLMMFMEDRATQLVLGAFVGVFLFALVVLGEVSELDDGFVPDLAVAATIVIATGAFGLVIYFVHHMALAIQADVIVADLGRRFARAIGRVARKAQTCDIARANRHVAEFEGFAGTPVPAPSSGYIRHIAYDRLLDILQTGGLRLVIDLRVDDYVGEAMPMAHVEGPAPDVGALAKCFTLGPRRDVLQEATYEARALIDIALRGLSPGINDPNTAVAAIDHMSGALLPLVRSEGVPRVLFTEDGRAALRRPDLGLTHYLDLIVPALLPAMRTDTLATERLIELLILFDRVSRQDDARETIAKWRKVMARDVDNHQLPQTMVDWLKEKAAE
ncbi:DUF2254 domain-containing protein [Pelagibacterium halotolerans]|uniref:DUF2254 domain-containing protein n=1 Tax=Pelagibacterium halotolerans (strain DSM 22347 / JCM 15775 / CGMCC 1.7692 / B2) TaxID=1082931 RepID=G4R6B9_PELHB|nr:DUF2254 domain-containing protein [Pelagibacterium halotolerans]AEQ53184.1 hypothetical protein KKY_3195 [Pelagibacterium halotolerans B2]QJR17177.1 DUF2254 domain-containing protein [Pelagibacterium halotolerans]SEA89699.1 Uncharacterized membrane protein [Pelagibacterium halotolerans]